MTDPRLGMWREALDDATDMGDGAAVKRILGQMRSAGVDATELDRVINGLVRRQLDKHA